MSEQTTERSSSKVCQFLLEKELHRVCIYLMADSQEVFELEFDLQVFCWENMNVGHLGDIRDFIGRKDASSIEPSFFEFPDFDACCNELLQRRGEGKRLKNIVGLIPIVFKNL